MTHRVTYTAWDGSLQQALVETSSASAAAEALGIDVSRIQKIDASKPSMLDALSKRVPNHRQQKTIITGLMVRLKSGRSGTDYLNDVAGTPFFQRDAVAIRGALNISDKMRLMHFDRYLVLLVSIGEKTNQLVTMTETAVADMNVRATIKAERRKKLITPFILMGMALSYLLGVPILMVPEIQQNLDTGYSKIIFNPLTDLAFFLSKAYLEHTAIVLMIAGSVIAAMIAGVRSFPLYYPFRWFTEVSQARRAVDFATTFPALYASGYNEVDTIEAIIPTLGAEDRAIYESLLSHVRAGNSIGNGFRSDQWSPLFMDIAGSLSAIKPMALRGYFQEILRDLIDDYIVKQGRITTFFVVLSMLLLGLSLAMMMIGLYLPQATASMGSM